MPATGVSAVIINVAAVTPTKAGYLTVFPSDRSTPQASNINFVAGLDVANQVIVPIGADGKVILLSSSAGATDLIADVAGYFTTAPSRPGGPSTPCPPSS